MTLSALKARAVAWQKAHAALVDEINADAGDVTEEQNARFNELFEEAALIRTELSANGFAFLFNEAAEIAKPLAA